MQGREGCVTPPPPLGCSPRRLEWVPCVCCWKQAGSWQRFVPLHLTYGAARSVQPFLGSLGAPGSEEELGFGTFPCKFGDEVLPLFGRAPLLLPIIVIFMKKGHTTSSSCSVPCWENELLCFFGRARPKAQAGIWAPCSVWTAVQAAASGKAPGH